MNKQKLMVFGIVMLCLALGIVIGSAHASTYYEQNTNVTLKVPCSNEGAACSVTATCNINILFPNSTTMITTSSMDNLGGGYFVYNLTYVAGEKAETTALGDYDTTIFCIDGADKGVSTFTYIITTNGNEPPTGITIAFFSILFIIIICGLLGLILYTIFHFIQLDFDAKDLIINVASYFGLLAVYMLSKEYLGHAGVNSILLMAIQGGAVIFVIVPLIAFFVSFFKGQTEEGGF